MENETPSGLGLLGAGRDVAGLPFFPLASPLFLQGTVAPTFPTSFIPITGSDGDPSALQQAGPGLRGQDVAGGQECPENEGH